MGKIPRTDRRARYIATTKTVDRAAMIQFAAGKHRLILSTRRRDGRPQMSPVTGVVTDGGTILISTYPQRAKTFNIRRHSEVSVVVLGDEFNDPWIQIDGNAAVVGLPDAVELLVEYFRAISGEHPDWDDYRQAMVEQGKSVIRVEPTRWSPIATGGYPEELFAEE